MRASETDCAREVAEVTPLVMAAIRGEMRRGHGSTLSVPQFRSLIFISRHRGTSLSALAAHIGLTLPSMSKLIDGLVSSGLIRRASDRQDRRRITLTLTGRGEAALRKARAATHDFIAGRLAGLSPEERTAVIETMRILRGVFGSTVQPLLRGRGKRA